ncbi:MAG: hypothetical protein HUU50_19745 [Candidatus Brocadiae bacterium]|nr:hypothetical protein [Candidatus Brocadiia bacterium]
MMRYIFFFFLFFLFAFEAVSDESLHYQYKNAYRFASQAEVYLYKDGEAKDWALGFLEKHAFLSPQKTLFLHYQDAYGFALNHEVLQHGEKEADIWARKLVIKQYNKSLKPYLSMEWEEFLENCSTGTPEENSQWLLQFMESESPFACSSSPFKLFCEVREFLRRRAEFAMDAEKAAQIANNFIQKRYFFGDFKDISSQYFESYEYALNRNSLNYSADKAFYWAKNFITKRGSCNPKLNLKDQYTEAFRFAYDSLRMDDIQARSWALNFLIQRGSFSLGQSILDQFKEAFSFAYTGDFLPILHAKNQPRGVFLSDEATKWAEKFLMERGRISLPKDLLEQYDQAALLAYSMLGLQLEREEALLWAKKWIERNPRY